MIVYVYHCLKFHSAWSAGSLQSDAWGELPAPAKVNLSMSTLRYNSMVLDEVPAEVPGVLMLNKAAAGIDDSHLKLRTCSLEPSIFCSTGSHSMIGMTAGSEGFFILLFRTDFSFCSPPLEQREAQILLVHCPSTLSRLCLIVFIPPPFLLGLAMVKGEAVKLEVYSRIF